MSAAFSLPASAGVASVLTRFSESFRAFSFAVLLVAASAVPALAGPFEDAVAQFANDSYSDTEEAVGVLATGGNPLAYPIISALQDGRLMADPDTKKVFVTGPDGKIIDAATGVRPSPACRTARPPCASTTSYAASSRQRLAD